MNHRDVSSGPEENYLEPKTGFTLIELLVVIAIVGLVAGAIFTTLNSAISSAQGAYELRIAEAVHKAFHLKAIDDNITTWWHEDDFPSQLSWGAYIEDLVDAEIIDEFLPIIPDNQNYGGGDDYIPYSYDNDGDTFTDNADCSIPRSGTDLSSGVNVVFRLGIPATEEKWQIVFEYLDESIDGGDGAYCGLLRGRPTGNGAIIYSIDTDQTPPH